jgi:hypothetical protein
MRERGRTLPEELAAVEDIQPIKERLSGRELELIEQEPANDAKQITSKKSEDTTSKPAKSKGEDEQTALFS